MGSRIPGLITCDAWDSVFKENKAALLEDAGIREGQVWIRIGNRKPRPGRTTWAEWFAAQVKNTVRAWLATAGQPPVREIAGELGELKSLLYVALGSHSQEAVAKAVAAYRALSPAAVAAIPGPDNLIRDRAKVGRDSAGATEGPAKPTFDELVRHGDDGALQRLFGLIPIRGDSSLDGPKPFVHGVEYEGLSADELHQPGRPSDVRVEQLFRKLVIIYELATGECPPSGQHTPFYRFANSLVGHLTNSDDVSERGDRALERALIWSKSLYLRNKSKKGFALPRTGRLSRTPPASSTFVPRGHGPGAGWGLPPPSYRTAG